MVTISLLPMDFKLSLHNVLFGQSEFLATEQAYLKICVLVSHSTYGKHGNNCIRDFQILNLVIFSILSVPKIMFPVPKNKKRDNF